MSAAQPATPPHATPPGVLPDTLAGKLRQMIAVLDDERQALAALDLDAITLATEGKQSLCSGLTPANDRGPAAAPDTHIDAECRGLLEAARHANETNRRIRNLLAANVAARLEALSGAPATYRKPLTRIA